MIAGRPPPHYGVQDFTKLIAWQKAHALALKVVESLPPSTGRRVPGLRAQAIRSALGIST